MKLFVYGTLKKMLKSMGAEYLGDYETSRRWVLADLGPFPGMISGEGVVKGQVWEIPAELLPQLDSYEGHPNLFIRRAIEVRPTGSDSRFYDWVDTYLYNSASGLLNVKTCTSWGD